MHIFLSFVFVTFITTFASAEVQVESQGVGLLDLSLDGMVSDEHLLFQTEVPSTLACASACLKYDCCAAFSTSANTSSDLMTCWGHDSMSVSQSSAVAVPGSKTYFMEKTPRESSWLERPCTTNSDCPATVANVECFATAGQCLCTPGYYYSFCRDACVLDCASQDLQSTFLKYPKHSEAGSNIAEVLYDCPPRQTAWKHCIALSECRSIDVWLPYDRCYMQSRTALFPGGTWRAAEDVDYYQRTCL